MHTVRGESHLQLQADTWRCLCVCCFWQHDRGGDMEHLHSMQGMPQTLTPHTECVGRLPCKRTQSSAAAHQPPQHARPHGQCCCPTSPRLRQQQLGVQAPALLRPSQQPCTEDIWCKLQHLCQLLPNLSAPNHRLQSPIWNLHAAGRPPAWPRSAKAKSPGLVTPHSCCACVARLLEAHMICPSGSSAVRLGACAHM